MKFYMLYRKKNHCDLIIAPSVNVLPPEYMYTDLFR